MSSFLADIQELGYEGVVFSGGEPTLYPALPEALNKARSLGLSTAVISNGSRRARTVLKNLAGLANTIAVSIDGLEAAHNELRRNSQSFADAVRTLSDLASAGVSTAVIHTVTRRSLSELADIAQLCMSVGASRLHLHPLETVGRAADEMPLARLGHSGRRRLFVQALALNAAIPGLDVHLDLVPRAVLLEQADYFYAAATPTHRRVGGLVVTAAGDVAPLVYGIHSSFNVCNLRQSSLADSWTRYESRGEPRLRRLCRTISSWVEETTSEDLVPWHEMVVGGSHGPLQRQQLGP